MFIVKEQLFIRIDMKPENRLNSQYLNTLKDSIILTEDINTWKIERY